MEKNTSFNMVHKNTFKECQIDFTTFGDTGEEKKIMILNDFMNY